MAGEDDQHREPEPESEWQGVAAGWERRRERIRLATQSVSDRMLARLAPAPGQTILELAAGVGDTGFAAAKQIEPGGLLISSDASEAMVAAARRRASELGLSNVEFRVLDAERLDLPDASVDGILCRFGYMLLRDPLAALREARRVLRDDAPLVFAVWAGPERNPWATLPRGVLAERGAIAPPPPDEPGMFTLSDSGRLTELATAAGFSEPRIEEVGVEWEYADAQDFWDVLTDTSPTVRTVEATLGERERARIREEIAIRLRAFAIAGKLRLPGVALVVTATA